MNGWLIAWAVGVLPMIAFFSFALHYGESEVDTASEWRAVGCGFAWPLVVVGLALVAVADFAASRAVRRR